MTHWIAGEWVAGTGEKLQSHTPYSHELLWQGYSASGEQVDAAVNAARRAFLDWKKRPFAEREQKVLAFAELVKANSEQIAQVIAKETGKPLWETRTEAASIAGKSRFRFVLIMSVPVKRCVKRRVISWYCAIDHWV